MKNFSTILAALSVMASANVSADVMVNVRPLGDVKPLYVTPSYHSADVLVDEDFSAFASGTFDNPDLTMCLADEYGQLAESEYIDVNLTHGVQWRGNLVYPAGGACFINNTDPQSPNYLKTPVGDYSGEIKVTFRARALETHTALGILTGTTLSVSLGGNSYKEFDCDMPTKDIRLYPHNGWCEVEFVFNNYTADNDACLAFYCSGGLLLDDIRVTASSDNFIASPTLEPVSDVKADGFTVNWQGVRKAYNYYVYLYTLDGYDENGEPVYRHEFSPTHLEMIESDGMTVEEYMEMMPEQYLTWDPSGSTTVDAHAQRSFTFYGLDPEKEYYYDVRSHYVSLFSKPQITHANVVSAPECQLPSEFLPDGFTANWNAAPKATGYDVTLYGVTQLTEDDDYFPLIDEDFSNTEEYTDAENFSQAENLWMKYGDDFDFNMLTNSPGWETPYTACISLVKGYMGLNEWGGELETPALDVAGADHVDLYLKMASPVLDFTLYLSFAGKSYMIQAEGMEFDEGIQLPTNGLSEARLWMGNVPQIPVFIDRIQITQPKKSGANVYTWLDKQRVEAPDVSCTFEGLDTEMWMTYGYDVVAIKEFDGKTVKSTPSGKMIADLETQSGRSKISNIVSTAAEPVEVERYTIDGRRISSPRQGVNIVRYSDGSVKKVYVR